MRGNFSVLLLILLTLTVYAQVQPSPPKNSDEPTLGTISGKVVNESGQPLAGASLFVRAIGSATAARATASDVEGNFHVNGLEPGLYTVFANSPAYTTATPDAGTPATYYRLGDSVRVELVRGGVITGTVTNASGEPLIAVRVRVTMIRDGKGQALQMPLFAFNEESTDDRGIYRIYGLAPGTYLVSAGGSGVPQAFQLSPYDFDVPTYAPSSTRDNAAEVIVRGGEESNVDIRYRGEPGHSISGTAKVMGTNIVSITLTAAGNLTAAVGSTFQLPGSRGFVFSGIGDGDYDLQAREVVSGQNSLTPVLAYSESKRITVKGADVTGIELLTKPLASVSGRFAFEPAKVPECQGKRPPLFAETLVLYRRHEKDPEKDGSGFIGMFGTSSPPDSKGAFVLRNLIPGRYQFEPRFYARYWYLQSIILGTATAKPQKIDAAATWTVVKSGDQLSNLTITLAEGAASIRGQLAAAEPPAGMSVYLVPAEPDKTEDVLRFFVTDIAADGAFAFNNLPPGRYWALAQTPDPQLATLAKLRQPEAATMRTKLRRTAEAQKSEIQLKPCQNVADYQLK
jgi:Carboxypeptidase regulatory-like domain